MFLIKHFIASNIHLGHQVNKWNPRTCYFLLGMRDGIFLIDLEQTLIMLKRALTFIKKICLKRGYIFYVPSQDSFFKSTKFFNDRINNLTFHQSGSYFNLLFLSSNYYSSSKQRGMLYALTQKRKELPILPDKTSNVILKDDVNFHSFNLFLRPQALFMLQVNSNSSLIKEAVKFQIPIVGILDSNSKPYAIQYPIPGNDSSKEAYSFYTELLINTILDTKKTEIKTFL